MSVGNPRLLGLKPGRVKVQILFGNKEFKVRLYLKIKHKQNAGTELGTAGESSCAEFLNLKMEGRQFMFLEKASP